MIEISENSNETLGYINESFNDLIKRSRNSQIVRHIRSIESEMKETGNSEERKRTLIERLSYCNNMLKLRHFVEV